MRACILRHRVILATCLFLRREPPSGNLKKQGPFMPVVGQVCLRKEQ